MQSARLGVRFALMARERLEVKLSSDLQFARNVIRRDRPEGGCAKFTDAIAKLGWAAVIERIERFQAQLEAGPFS